MSYLLTEGIYLNLFGNLTSFYILEGTFEVNEVLNFITKVRLEII